jgi:hypothetical protein
VLVAERRRGGGVRHLGRDLPFAHPEVTAHDERELCRHVHAL